MLYTENSWNKKKSFSLLGFEFRNFDSWKVQPHHRSLAKLVMQTYVSRDPFAIEEHNSFLAANVWLGNSKILTLLFILKISTFQNRLGRFKFQTFNPKFLIIPFASTFDFFAIIKCYPKYTKWKFSLRKFVYK